MGLKRRKKNISFTRPEDGDSILLGQINESLSRLREAYGQLGVTFAVEVFWETWKSTTKRNDSIGEFLDLLHNSSKKARHSCL